MFKFSYAAISSSLSRLFDLFQESKSTMELTSLVEDAIDELLPNEYTGLYLWDEEHQRLKLIIAKGFNQDEKNAAEETAMVRHPGIVFKSGVPLYIPDTLSDQYNRSVDSPRSFTIRCRLYLPIIANNQIIGTFGVVSSKPDYFDEESIAIFKFICQLAGSNYFRLQTKEREIKDQILIKKLSLIATEIESAVVITDHLGLIEWVNTAFEKMTGYVLDEIVGQSPGRLLQGKDTDPNVRTLIREAIKEKKKVVASLVNYTKSGTAYRAHLQIFPVMNANNEIQNFIALQQDITEEYNVQLKIHEQQSALQAIIQTIPDQLFVITRNYLVEQYYNNAHSTVSVEHDSGHHLDFYFKDSDVVELIKNKVVETTDDNSCVQFGFSITIEGESQHFEARIAELDSERVVMQVRDVTNTVNSLKERDRQEELLHRVNNKLNRQNEKLLNFSYIVSHNIRSYSSNITGFSQILSDGVKDPAMSKFVEGLQKASESLDMTLRHLNELINIQSGKDVKLASIPLFPALQNTVATLAYDINTYDVGLDIQVPADFCVDAYDVYLDSILLNLFSNAIKYRQEHLPLTISVKCGFSEGYKWFSITDNGLGIDLDLFGSKLFGMFQTFHQQPQSKGVGLFILKNQVEALQGKVEVESEVGQGTTFKIYLPEL